MQIERSTRSTHGLRCVIAAAGVLCAGAVPPASAFDVTASPDVATSLSGTIVLDREVVSDDLAGGLSLAGFGGLPEGTAVDAYHDDGGGVVLFSVDTATSLPGGVVAEPEDVVRLSGSTYTLEFDGSANGAPAGANLDAVTRDGSGDLILSFDTTVDVGILADDEDLLRLGGGGFSLVFDGSASGLDPALDVDAVHAYDGGLFAISLDGSGSLLGVRFDDEDVLLVDPTGPSAAMLFDASSEHAGWGDVDLEAVALPEPGGLPGLVAGFLSIAALSRRRAPKGERTCTSGSGRRSPS